MSIVFGTSPAQWAHRKKIILLVLLSFAALC